MSENAESTEKTDVPVPTSGPVEGEASPPQPGIGRAFPDGRSLDLQSSIEITADSPTQVIVLAGPSESGKTTLLASIYDMFCWGPFAGYVFSGSRTLPGFEERCHLSRLASEGTKADTRRTRLKPGVDFLHLRVSPEKSLGNQINLIFTDLAGEAFRLIRDSTDECRRMTVLSRADHFTILVDGAQISDRRQRHVAEADCRSLLRSTLDSGMLGKNTLVEVIFSKWDLVEPHHKRNENTDFRQNVQTNLAAEFKDFFGAITFYEIASRPESQSDYRFGYRLDKIFPIWAEGVLDPSSSISGDDGTPTSLRQIDQYSAQDEEPKGRQ